MSSDNLADNRKLMLGLDTKVRYPILDTWEERIDKFFISKICVTNNTKNEILYTFKLTKYDCFALKFDKEEYERIKKIIENNLMTNNPMKFLYMVTSRDEVEYANENIEKIFCVKEGEIGYLR